MLFEARDISVELEGDEGLFYAVRDISFQAPSGTITDIVGPSGAGKSTFLHAFGAQMVSVTGEMYLSGRPYHDYEPSEWRARVALVQQRPVLVPGTVKDNLLVPWTLKVRHEQQPPSDDAFEKALADVGLAEIALDRPMEKLSVGQQARLAFMRTVLTDPDVLLLDEVDAALDNESSLFIGQITTNFAQRGKAVVRVRHRADDGRANRRLVLNAGRVVTVETLTVHDAVSAGVTHE